jgi:hypothetical protein
MWGIFSMETTDFLFCQLTQMQWINAMYMPFCSYFHALPRQPASYVGPQASTSIGISPSQTTPIVNKEGGQPDIDVLHQQCADSLGRLHRYVTNVTKHFALSDHEPAISRAICPPKKLLSMKA